VLALAKSSFFFGDRDQIRINLTKEDKERLAQKPSGEPGGLRGYLKGRYYWNKRSGEGFEKAIDILRKRHGKIPNMLCVCRACRLLRNNRRNDLWEIAGIGRGAKAKSRDASAGD